MCEHHGGGDRTSDRNLHEGCHPLNVLVQLNAFIQGINEAVEAIHVGSDVSNGNHRPRAAQHCRTKEVDLIILGLEYWRALV